MKNLLLSERWRPKSLDDIVLLPRIRKLFEDGVDQNFIFHGHFGTGKTTLARILIGKYSKNKPHLELNSSFHTSIDTLRTKVDEFCSKVYMGLDLTDDLPQENIKYVFLDEFDRTSIQYQDALKAYIEEYSKKNVRFIFTTNHINKISPGIRSRLIEVNFDCFNSDEERLLKQEIYKKIKNKICTVENFDIPKEILVKIINKKFPDFRSILIGVDQFRLSGQITLDSNNTSIKSRDELYKIIFEENISFEECYSFIDENFGADGLEMFFNCLGKNFIDFCIQNNVESKKLFEIVNIVCENNQYTSNASDPLILSLSTLGKIKDVISR
jgi:replication-associated recombination protein RarA